MILVVDNYDSFTWNLAQALQGLGARVAVHLHDALDVAQLRALGPSAIVLSPGPGRPRDAGITLEVIRRFAGELPILGICLGHQAIGEAFGARVVRARTPMHGRTSMVEHDGRGVFAALPSPVEVMRYHSLVLERASVAPPLEVTATTADGEIMGVRHTSLDVEGVQFHPESFLSERGTEMLATFAARAGGRP